LKEQSLFRGGKKKEGGERGGVFVFSARTRPEEKREKKKPHLLPRNRKEKFSPSLASVQFARKNLAGEKRKRRDFFFQAKREKEKRKKGFPLSSGREKKGKEKNLKKTAACKAEKKGEKKEGTNHLQESFCPKRGGIGGRHEESERGRKKVSIPNLRPWLKEKGKHREEPPSKEEKKGRGRGRLQCNPFWGVEIKRRGKTE